MSLFGYNFKLHHVHKVEAGKKYMPEQLRKLAIERYLFRKADPTGPRPLTNTVLFLTANEKEQLRAHVLKAVGAKTYSYAKPYVFKYPDPALNKFTNVQTLTAVVIVTEGNIVNFNPGATVIFSPTVTLHYGNIGNTGAKHQAIFHLDDTASFSALSTAHADFSPKQKLALAALI